MRQVWRGAAPRKDQGATTGMRQHIVSVTRRLRRRIARIVAFSLIFEFLTLLVLAPLSSAVLHLFLQRWGRCSVGNFELGVLLVSPVGMSAAVIIATIALAAGLLSIIATATLAGLILAFYCALDDFSLPAADRQGTGKGPRRIASLRTWALVSCAMPAVSAAVSALVLERIHLQDAMQITAHRAGAAVAPENTVVAIRKAIEAKADWAEIDVQRAADGALLVLHDSDLRRVAGVSGRVVKMTLADIHAIDVGSAFGEAFAGERIPTLSQVIAAAGNRIRLNIELKPHGPGDVQPLVEAVVATVRRTEILTRCRICSQSYQALRLTKQLAPELEIGFIAGASLGDLSKLDVDFLMVTARMATRRLIDAAAARGMKVHAWTVNDPDQLLRLLDRGVANVITDDPAAMRARLQEIRDLHPAARLLLRTHNLLAD